MCYQDQNSMWRKSKSWKPIGVDDEQLRWPDGGWVKILKHIEEISEVSYIFIFFSYV